MAKGRGAKGKQVTLKRARQAVTVLADGRRRLSLSHMGLTVFPRCLLALGELDELDLSRNRIRSLPRDVGALLGLRRLDLHTNELEAVPESVGQLASLTHLDLSNNRLTAAGLPYSLGSLTRLQCLNLGMNRLDALPPTVARMSGLRDLRLFDNLFAELPECVRALGGLTRLNVERNPLTLKRGAQEDLTKPTEGVYLATDRSLCHSCLGKLREERDRLSGRTSGERGGGDSKVIRRGNYSGLLTPNSVAASTQEVWRPRRQED